MLSHDRNEILKNSTHLKGPSSFVRRDAWLNLCVDLDSFVSECFSNTQPKTQGVRTVSQGRVEGRPSKNQQDQ